MRILIIDDQPLMLALLRAQVEALGESEVTAFQSAQEALDHLSQGGGSPDVILCDLNMPGMDGVLFMRHLAGLKFAGGLVLISVEDQRILDSAEKVGRAHNLRVLGVLRKPVSLDDLRATLGAVPAVVQRRRGRNLAPEDLRRGIAAGELVNHYQPKVELASGALAGVECLVRWQHPELGLVYPDDFVGMAEQQGVIGELTDAVIALALRQAKSWADAGIHTSLAVNVSMDNLTDVDFADRLAAEAEAADVALTALRLEVTESRLMNDRAVALEILTRLRLRRVELFIDDFGTGHSSLAQLRDLPFSGLKIDRNFVHSAWNDAALNAILEASIAMAKKLGMRTVAEGVEDLEDWNFLRASGCELAQGYFIARPFAGAELPRWAAEWEPRRRHLTAT